MHATVTSIDHGCHSPWDRVYATMTPHPKYPTTRTITMGGCQRNWEPHMNPSIVEYDSVAGTWTRHNVTGDVPFPISHHTANVIDDENIVVIGGEIGPHTYSAVRVLNTSTYVFEQKTLLSTSLYGHVCAFDTDSHTLFVHGGAISRRTTSTILAIDTQTWRITKVNPPGGSSASLWPAARLYHRGVGVQSKATTGGPPFAMYIHGGAPDTGNTTARSVVFGDLWVYTPTTSSSATSSSPWREITQTGTVPSKRGSTVFQQVSMYLMLYGGFDGVQVFRDAYLFDMDTEIWRELILASEMSLYANTFWGRMGAVGSVVHSSSDYDVMMLVSGGLPGSSSGGRDGDDEEDVSAIRAGACFQITFDRLRIGSLKFLCARWLTAK
eukprot:PhF_6_TR27830/c0_g1_i1/m.40603